MTPCSKKNAYTPFSISGKWFATNAPSTAVPVMLGGEGTVGCWAGPHVLWPRVGMGDAIEGLSAAHQVGPARFTRASISQHLQFGEVVQVVRQA